MSKALVKTKSKPIRKMGLAVKPSFDENVIYTLRRLLQTLNQLDIDLCFICPPGKEFIPPDIKEAQKIKIIATNEIAANCELILIVGGDGTFLSYARSAALSKVPILGINCGRVGFLTEIATTDINVVVKDIAKGSYLSSERIMLKGEIKRLDRKICEYHCLNDLVVHSQSGRVMEAELYINNKFVYCERSDGIIIASSSGSTAYAMSAGGPIILPQAMAIEVVNISPHNLTSRPLILPESSEIGIKIKSGESIAFYGDGRGEEITESGDEISIYKDELAVPLIHHTSYDFFSACRSKLGWHSQDEYNKY